MRARRALRRRVFFQSRKIPPLISPLDRFHAIIADCSNSIRSPASILATAHILGASIFNRKLFHFYNEVSKKSCRTGQVCCCWPRRRWATFRWPARHVRHWRKHYAFQPPISSRQLSNAIALRKVAPWQARQVTISAPQLSADKMRQACDMLLFEPRR